MDERMDGWMAPVCCSAADEDDDDGEDNFLIFCVPALFMVPLKCSSRADLGTVGRATAAKHHLVHDVLSNAPAGCKAMHVVPVYDICESQVPANLVAP